MKYAPSALIGRLSRSAGSTTAGHNRYGAYLRNRVIPTNPASPAQTAVRGNFGTLSSGWRGLTSAQRTAWSSLGANITRTDTLGQTYTLTGQAAYMLVNRNLYTIGGSAVTDPPAYSPPAALATAVITATAT